MPWNPSDAPQHTRQADTAHLREIWAETANSVLSDTGDEARAIRAGDAAVRREKVKEGRRFI